MFDPKYDDARETLAEVQAQITDLAVKMNAVNPNGRGRGLTAGETHQAIAIVAGCVHNVAHALGGILDLLDGPLAGGEGG